MNVVRSQIEQFSANGLREQFQAAVEETVRTGKIPAMFKGDPTFFDAVSKRRKSSENADQPARPE